MPLHGGCCYFPRDDILELPAENVIYNIWVELYDDALLQRTNPRHFPKFKTGFHQFERRFEWSIIKPHRDINVIPNCAPGIFVAYKRSFVANENVACVHEHDHIVNIPAAGSRANMQHSTSCPAESLLLSGWNTVAGLLVKDLYWGWVFF